MAKKRLYVSRVDTVGFVGKGDNPAAEIVFFKRAPEGVKKQRREDGFDFPIEAYAYTPDPADPGTWDVRLWESPELRATAAQVGRAVAVLGKGFRGRRVSIPAADLPAVRARVMKEAETFAELRGMRDAREEIWQITSDLSCAFHEALESDGDRATLLATSLSQFVSAVQGAIPKWLQGETSTKQREGKMQNKVGILKSLALALGISKEELGTVKPEDLLSADPTPPAPPAPPAADPVVAKALADMAADLKAAKDEAASANALAKALRDEKENARVLKLVGEMLHLPGVSGDDFAPIMRAAEKALSKEQFEKLVAVLKGSNEIVKSSVIFTEIGRGGASQTGTEAEVMAKAKGFQKADPKLSDQLARAKVYKAFPALLAKVEEERQDRVRAVAPQNEE